MTTKLPLFYFKPTICWVDDDQLFLDAAKLSFDEEYFCITYNSPQEAINFFNTYQSPLDNIPFTREFTESETFGVHNHFPVDIDIAAISQVYSNTEKAQDIAILIVDYHMADMHGIALCQQLKNFKGKKILLTGEATYELAVEAFNEGIIDKFVKKGPNIAAILQKYMADLAYQYFCERTERMVMHLEASRSSVLTDKCFIEFFNEWRVKHAIEEFYLVNKQGAFLLKDRQGKTSYFVLQSASDNAEFIKLNDEVTGDALALLDQVEAGKLIPFFGEQAEAWQIDTNIWHNYFYPANKLEGRETYYWAVVDSIS